MHSRQTVTLTCRLVSLWFFFHAGTGLLTTLPVFYSTMRLTMVTGRYRNYGIGASTMYNSFTWALLATFLPVTLELFFGILFFRAGSGVTRFLFGEDVKDPPAAEGTA